MKSNTPIAVASVGASGTKISKMFDGRWVKTIVLSSPARSAILRGDHGGRPACSSPAAKNTVDISS